MLTDMLMPRWLGLVGLGLLAGLVTNAVAIWMLFHPYRPVRLGPVRIFPQGAIPKEIDRIARRIGQTVGTHLLRATDIANTLRQPEFRARFNAAVRQAIDELFRRDLGALSAEIPDERLTEVARTVEDFGRRLLSALVEYLEGPAFEARVREFVGRLRGEFGDEPLERILTPELRRELLTALHDLGEAVVLSPGFRGAVDEFFTRHLRAFLTSEESLGRYLPAGAINFGEAVVQNYLPLVLDRFGEVLESPAAQERVRAALRGFIDRYLSEQGVVKQVLGRLIITERTLTQTVQALERGGAEEIAALLREPLMQARASEAVNGAIDELLRRPVREIFGDLTEEEVTRIRDVLTERVVEFFRHETTEEFLLGRVSRLLRAAEGKRLDDLIEYLGRETSARIGDRLTDWIVEAARGNRARELLEAMLVQQTEWLLSVPIGRIADYLPSDGLERAERILFEPLWEFLQSRVPILVTGLPISEMVEERIRTYPIPDFERLIWNVTRRELRLIIYLGGFLGAVVGALSVVLQAPLVGVVYLGFILVASYLFLNVR